MNLIRKFFEEWFKEAREEREGEAFIVLQFLANRRDLSLAELADMTSESPSRVRKSLRSLRKRGLIQEEAALHRDYSHTLYYRITDKGRTFYTANAPTGPSKA